MCVKREINYTKENEYSKAGEEITESFRVKEKDIERKQLRKIERKNERKRQKSEEKKRDQKYRRKREEWRDRYKRDKVIKEKNGTLRGRQEIKCVSVKRDSK